MAQRTVYVEHRDQHQAPEGALEAAVAEKGLPTSGYVVSSLENVSGEGTKFHLSYEDSAFAPEKPAKS